MDHSQHTPDLDETVELPYAEIFAAKRRIEARVENPIDTPHPTEHIPDGPEIENPAESEDPKEADTGPSSRSRRWN